MSREMPTAASPAKEEMTETEKLAQQQAEESANRMAKWGMGTESASEAPNSPAEEPAPELQVAETSQETQLTPEQQESAKTLETIKQNDIYDVSAMESSSGKQALAFTRMQIRVLRGEEPPIKDLSIIAGDLGIQSANKWTHFQRQFSKLSQIDRNQLAAELDERVKSAETQQGEQPSLEHKEESNKTTTEILEEMKGKTIGDLKEALGKRNDYLVDQIKIYQEYVDRGDGQGFPRDAEKTQLEAMKNEQEENAEKSRELVERQSYETYA